MKLGSEQPIETGKDAAQGYEQRSKQSSEQRSKQGSRVLELPGFRAEHRRKQGPEQSIETGKEAKF